MSLVNAVLRSYQRLDFGMMTCLSLRSGEAFASQSLELLIA